MGIDIYARWKGQSEEERDKQASVWLSSEAGANGYLREAYHGEPYATMFLCSEAFSPEGAQIPSGVLRERLPHALALVEERCRKLYHASEAEIEGVKQSFRGFVSLCERKEKETGEPVLVTASF